MEPTTYHNIKITMKSGRTLSMMVSKTELDWLYDRCFGRTQGSFQNMTDEDSGITVIVNMNEIEYIRHINEEEELKNA